MPHLRKILPFLLLVLAVASCQRQSRVSRVFGLVENEPDSALRVLAGEDCCGFEGIDRNWLNDDELAEWALAYCWALDRSGVDVASDSVLRIAYDHYSRRPDAPHYARCIYYMGKYFALADSSEKAMDCTVKARRRAQADGDIALECLATHRLSQLMYYHDMDSAEHYARLALERYRSCPDLDSTNLVYYLLNLSEFCVLNDSIDKAISIAREALDISSAVGKTSVLSSVCQDLSVMYQEKGDMDSAIVFSKQANSLYDSKDAAYMLSLAGIYIKTDSLAQAIDVLNKTVTPTPLHTYTKFYFQHMAAIKRQQLDTAMMYADSAYKHLERMYANATQAKDEYYESAIKAERDKAAAEAKSEAQSLIITLSTAIFALCVLFAAYYWRTYREKTRRRRDFENALHRKELSHKETQLATMRQFLTKKVEIVSRLTDKPADLSPLSEEDWQEIETFLEGVDNLFVTRLRQRHPDLKPKDVRLFMLLRLKVPSKSLALIYGISEKSVKQNLFLAKNKVGLAGKDTSLREYIERFDETEKEA